MNHARDYNLIVVCIWMCSEVKVASRGRAGTSILSLMRSWGGVESRSTLDQNTSWVIVEIPPVKSFTQCSFYVFLRRRKRRRTQEQTREGEGSVTV